MLGLGVFAVALRVVSVGQPESVALRVVYLLTGLLFTLSLIVILMRRIFGARTVTSDTIYGSIAVYLLFGMFWVYVYAMLVTLAPGSIEFGGQVVQRGNEEEALTGFSFVTLTTLGYGNVHPVTPQAQAAASMQAIVGQLYLTILVARLVGLNLSQAPVSERAGT